MTFRLAFKFLTFQTVGALSTTLLAITFNAREMFTVAVLAPALRATALAVKLLQGINKTGARILNILFAVATKNTVHNATTVIHICLTTVISYVLTLTIAVTFRAIEHWSD